MQISTLVCVCTRENSHKPAKGPDGDSNCQFSPQVKTDIESALWIVFTFFHTQAPQHMKHHPPSLTEECMQTPQYPKHHPPISQSNITLYVA